MAQTSVDFLWRWWNDNPFASYEQGIDAYRQAKEMHKAEQERMYNEEEVLKLLINFSDDRTFLKEDVAIQWFEQFKKQ